jgi:hypothetical protein
MPRTGWTPSVVPMVPYGADQTVYLVVDRDGGLGISDFDTTIADLMSGQINDPLRVIAFNTLEHWAQNVSRDVALEIQSRSDIDGHTFRKRFGTLSIATPALTGSSRCGWHRPCLGTVHLTSLFPYRVDRLPARCAMSQITSRRYQSWSVTRRNGDSPFKCSLTPPKIVGQCYS